jgi:ribosome-associated protein
MNDPTQHLSIEVTEQPIELCKLLKIANVVSGGGEAKIVISEGYVYLNGEVEFQKRKKVYDGDVIEFNGDVIQMVVNEELIISPVSSEQKVTREKKQQPAIEHPKNDYPSKSKSKESATTPTSTLSKRKPISF